MARREGGLTDLLGKIMSSPAGELVGRAVVDSLPTCEYCNRKAVPLRCFLCGSFACLDHGYASAGRREAICRPCLMSLLGEAADVGSSEPWEVLGIKEGSTRAEIERAFRRKAMTCHPDRFPGDEEKAREFRKLQWAHESALETTGGQSHE